MKISEAQKLFIKEGLTELVLSRNDMQELCATLMDLIAKTPDDFPTLFIMHFLSNPGDNKSSLMPDLSVRKLNVMCLACARLDLVREQGINIRKEISRSERIHQIYSEFFEEEANELLP